MPSACTKPDNKASTEAVSQIEKCVIVVEKKVRNLEKRKGKLDAYRAKKTGGETLNQDQEEAISKYEAVIQNLEFARDLQKQFQSMVGELEKLAKKKVKREKLERQEAEASRYRELLRLQDLLSNLGLDEVREDFKTGSHGAIKLSDNNFEQLDEIYKLITPSRDGDVSFAEQMSHAPDHIMSFLEGREKEVAGTTYKDLKELVDRINDCGYFDNLASRLEAAAGAEAITDVQEVEEVAPVSERVTEELPVENIAPPAVPEPVAPVASRPHPSLEAPVTAPEPEELTPAMPAPVLNGPPIIPDAQVPFEDDSFFSTAQYHTQQRREFKDIVDSVQGNFNFLQDSELDADSPHRMDPAVVAARPMGQRSQVTADASLMSATYQTSSLLTGDDQTASAASTYGQQMAATSDLASHHAASQPVSQSQHTDSLDFGAASTPLMADSIQQSASASLQFGAVDSLVSSHDSQTQSLASGNQSLEAAYSQNLMSQSLGGSTSSQHFGEHSTSSLMSSHMGIQDTSAVDGMGSASGGPGPQPIPLPSQTLPGQSLMGQTFSEADSSAGAQEKKPYTMNPNADPFTSTTMFSNSTTMSAPLQATASTGVSQGGAASLVEEPRKTAWNTITQQRPQPVEEPQAVDSQSDYPSYNSSQYQRNSGPGRGGRGGFNRGGGGGGGGGNRPSSNGYSRGGNRGGNSMYSNNRGDGNSNRGYSNSGRGGRGGNAWQGYPSRSDYRPEGGYQGYNNSFSSGANGMRGGPSRGSGSGGGRGGRGGGGYGRSGSSPYSQ